MSWLEMVESKVGDWTLMHQLAQEAKRVLNHDQVPGGGHRSPARVVLVNGTFDILHPGHVRRFYKALEHGEILIVSIDRDEDVRRAKGQGRPALRWDDRAFMVAALPIVAGVTYHSNAPCWFRPAGDYSLPSLIRFLRPDIWVRREEAPVALELDAAFQAYVRVVKLERQGSWSSTDILRRLAPF